ncbi:transcriptional regulator, partial [Pediococcus pentosaceus]|nr:transcriptional regulator [Pediococcus pentosaceus]
MSKIDKYIEKRSVQDADFAKQVEQEDINLEVAI